MQLDGYEIKLFSIVLNKFSIIQSYKLWQIYQGKENATTDQKKYTAQKKNQLQL